MLCRDVMSKNVRTVTPDATLLECAILMRDLDVGFLPVADPSGRLVGACTDRDIVIRAIASDKPHQSRIGDIMTKNPVSVRPDDDIDAALKVLADVKVSRVPVCDADGKCLGVISLHDIALASKSRKVGKVVEEVKEPTQGHHAH